MGEIVKARQGSGVAKFAESPNGGGSGAVVWVSEEFEEPFENPVSLGGETRSAKFEPERGETADRGEPNGEWPAVGAMGKGKVDRTPILCVVEAVEDRGGDHLLPGSALDRGTEDVEGLS